MKKFGVKSLNELIIAALEPISAKYDAVTQKIWLNWEEIVGKYLASLSCPSQVYFEGEPKIKGTLLIEMSNPGFALELQSYESIIVSKVNIYFGYEAIARIKLKIVKTAPTAQRAS